MKQPSKHRKGIFVLILIALISNNLSSQTNEQSRSFINRSHIAIAKVEKEMYFSGKNEFDAEIKLAIKYQLTAIKLHQQNKHKNAVAYSYRSRVLCMDICAKMNIAEGAYYNLNDTEKTYCDPVKYDKMKMDTNILDKSESQKIDDLNILDVQKFREIELSIK